ncbi:unnamed protein product [Urochloa humidicola]
MDKLLMRTAAVEKENYGKSNLAYTAGRNVRIKPAATPITDQCTRGDEQMLDNMQQCRVDPTPRREQKCSGPYIQVPLTPLSTSPAASGRPLPAAAPDPAGRGGLMQSLRKIMPVVLALDDDDNKRDAVASLLLRLI